jgi:hypothetical protein
MAARVLKENKSLGMEALRQFYEHVVSTTFVCCFSVDRVNTLMWSHYAEAHRGVCLVFDVGLFFDIGANDFTSLSVRYTDKPEAVNFPALWSEPESPKNHAQIKQALLGNKLSHWNYEQEVRLISKIRGRNKFPKHALTGVIVVARSSALPQVADILIRDYPSAKVISAKLNGTKGVVEVDDFAQSIVERIAIGANARGEVYYGRPISSGP